MKIFVTGANGKLARALIPALRKGNKLILTSRNAVETRQLFGNDFKIDEVDLERASLSALKRLVKDVDVIVHTAGLVDFNASKDKLFAANAEVTRKLAETGKPIIYISSVSVYRTRGAYGESKRLGESYIRKGGGNLILRLGMVYGGDFTEGFSSVIKLINKGFVFTLGDGLNQIPLVYYKDAVKAVVFSVKNFKKLKGGVFDVVFQPEPTQKECINEVAGLLGVSKKRWNLNLTLAHSFAGFLGKKDYVRMLSENRVYANTIKGFKFDYPLKKGLREFLPILGFK